MALSLVHSLHKKYFQALSSLAPSPRELYLIFASKLLEAFGYFSLSLLYTILLTERYGFSDYSAGVSYGVYGALIVGYNMLLGPFIDVIGIKRCLMTSFSLSALGRLALALSRSRLVVFGVLYGALPVASALGVPVMLIGVKRYTSSNARGVAFGVFYTLMNVAALLNGVVFDFFHNTFAAGFGLEGQGKDALLNDGLRMLIMVGAGTSVMGLGVVCFLRDGKYMNAAREEEETAGTWCPAGSEMRSLLKSRRTLKFFVVALFTINLRQLFRHLDATVPKYELRAFGCQVPVGWIYSINPIMIVIFVPVVGTFTTGINHYDMIHIGSYIGALSPFWLVAYQNVSAMVLFVVFLSLGEAIWSPRWYEYSMWIAPHGKEGIYTALSAAPMFLAKLQTGLLSGYLLEKFCPNNYLCQADDPPPNYIPQPCDGQRLWLTVGCITAISPIGLSILRKWLRPTDLELNEPDMLDSRKVEKSHRMV